jgi:hypothetical protein
MPDRLNVSIYNSAGELVRVLYDGMGQIQSGNFTLSSDALVPGGPGVTMGLSGVLQGGLSALVWSGTNDNGQQVSGGTYYFKVEQRDPMGGTQAWTKTITVMPPALPQTLAVYNSAGELVAQMSVASLGSNVVLSDVGFAESGQATFVVSTDPVNPSGVTFLVTKANGGTATLLWNGLNGQGQKVVSGSYTVQLVTPALGAQSSVFSKGFTIIDAPDSLSALRAIVVPNPVASGDQTITFLTPGLSAGDNTQVGIYNLAGELVARGVSTDPSRLVLPSSRWAGGIYLAVLEVRRGQTLVSRQLYRVAVVR